MKGKCAFTKVKDETAMGLDPEQFQNDISLKGMFSRMGLSEVEEEADRAAIIRTGLEALAGEEIGL